MELSFGAGIGFLQKLSFTSMDGNYSRFLKVLMRMLFGTCINNNQYLSVSFGSLSDITVHVIIRSIQGSLLLTGFTPQIATKKQVKYSLMI